MRIFLDTEFTHLPVRQGDRPQLISIALAAEKINNQELLPPLYVEVEHDFNACHRFVLTYIYPHLHKKFLSRDEAARAVKLWIVQAREVSSSWHKAPTLCATDDIDIQLIKDLLKGDQSSHWPYKTSIKTIPVGDESSKHHALDDVLRIRDKWPA